MRAMWQRDSKLVGWPLSEVRPGDIDTEAVLAWRSGTYATSLTDTPLPIRHPFLDQAQAAPISQTFRPTPAGPPHRSEDTQATIGMYRFTIPRDRYTEWVEAIRQSVGFAESDVIGEIKRRLGL